MHTTSWAALRVGQNSEFSLVNEQTQAPFQNWKHFSVEVCTGSEAGEEEKENLTLEKETSPKTKVFLDTCLRL